MADAVQKLSEWKAATKGKSGGGLEVRVEMILRVYHTKQASETEERVRLLGDLAKICREYIAGKLPTDPLYGAFVLLGAQADKQITIIQHAKGGWATLKKAFGPAMNSHGPTKTLQHYKQKDANPTSGANYWLEGLDPKHRSWGHMPPEIFERWRTDAGSTKNFWEWLEEKNLADTYPSVQYLAPDQRWKYMCVFGDDKIMYRHDLGVRGTGSIPLQRFSTFGLETAHSGVNFAVWVCSPGGIFYTNTHRVSEFHHSTFLAGGRVLAAGEWVVSAGKILLISHKTGHHAASPANLFNALQLLRQRVNLSRTAVEVRDYVNGTFNYVPATEYLTNSGNVTKCTPIPGFQPSWAKLRCDIHQDWDSRIATTPKAFRG